MGGSLSSCSDCSVSSLENTMNSKIFHPPTRSYDPESLNSNSCVIYSTTTASDLTVYLALVQPQTDTVSSKYIIFSTGNGADIFNMLPYAQHLANKLDLSVILYDYPGYGNSTGYCSENNCYEALASVVNFTMKRLEASEKDITLMGQSLGTGIVVDYVSKNVWNRPIILISPYKSIISVVYDSSIVGPIDKFKTLSKLDNVNCPVKIFHGLDDELINVSHGKTIHQRLGDKALEPTWLPGIGHNDILWAVDLAEINRIVNY